MNKNFIDELIGWYGAVAIFIAYVLISFNIISTNFWYYLLNGTGALGIVYISFKKKAYQPGVLNIFWALVALIAIIQLII